MFDIIKSNPLPWIIIFLFFVSPSLLLGFFWVILAIILLLVLFGIYINFKVRSMRRRMEEQMKSAAGGGARQHQQEGDVRVYSTGESQEKRVNKDVGDYIEFEEVKK